MSEPDSDLDGQIRRTDPDRWLSSRFIGEPSRREDVVAIYAYDNELARAPRVTSNALLGEVRLTWWREVLEEIFTGRTVRLHPVAQALALAVVRCDLAREPLEAMIEARYRELDATPMDEPEVLDWARDTGGLSSQLAAQVLDPATFPAVAHAALAGRPAANDFSRRLRLTIAVARGRI